MKKNGFKFTGDQKISLQPLISDISNNFTYEFWVRPQTEIMFANESINQVEMLKSQNWLVGPGYGGENGTDAGFGISIGTNGINVFEYGKNYFPTSLEYNFDNTSWNHYAIVYNNKTPYLYINGYFVIKGKTSNKDKVYPSGVLGALDSYGFFTGEFADVRIWDYPRSKYEIRQSRDSQITGNETGLLAYIDIDEKGATLKKGYYFNEVVYEDKNLYPIQTNRNKEITVSIIIPVCNKWEYTFSCVKSIIQHTLNINYEIIVADDMSTDQTLNIKNYFRNIVVVKDGKKRGFLKNCNNAVKHAKGRYLLFLNNDTLVKKDWLKYLLELFEKDKRVGVVGSKLIFPDGRLQEAGSIIFKDGSTLGYGRGDSPDKPEYSYVREVNYCSGACILVKKELFFSAGMFDEQFSPAYYEEVDLCMKIRELGYKVMYQPLSEVIHYEFGSSSSNEAVELMKKNREKFCRKWSKVLINYKTATQGQILSRDHKSNPIRILYIDDRIPDPKLGSGYPRTFSILQTLSELGPQITFFPLQNPEPNLIPMRTLQQKKIEVIYTNSNRKINFMDFYKNRKNYYDVVWISRPHNLKEVFSVIKSVNPNQKIIYDVEALFSQREILRFQIEGKLLSPQEKEKIINSEMDLIKKADILVTVSNQESVFIKKYITKPIYVIGHSVKLNITPKPFQERKDILFVGGFLTSPSPNEDAIYYFVKEIYPKIFQRTGANLWIVGVNNSKLVQSLASSNIRVTGKVENLWEYYNKCKVFVIPTRYAAGIPLKALEAFSYGLPSVVTPLIANQMNIKEGTVLIGNEPIDFVNKVVHCYNDSKTWHNLKENAIGYIKKEYSETRLKNTLGSILKTL
ncbi:GT2 family glycosyltransferase [Bacillus tianshenii]|uniref:GT2 family glycosyltransferase n=1 Tax=Sutcliffiella tianshenii TaxID=1463404 RepID=A0ABS2P559_9BACI|nr:glycosyltransferase [Bacillus tianshenii]MBM7622080.1 GT2 family glycosyltransferase [Bacillus tianshenii]